MRSIDLARDTVAAVPALGFVEVVQQAGNDKNPRPQWLSLSALRSEADAVAGEAGGGSAVVATADGLTTGLVPATASFVEITSSVATKQVSLPAAVAGKTIQLICQANGCEVISAVASDKVNDVVVGATNEAALIAGTLYTLVYDGTDNWVMTGLTGGGVVETPVTPDSL